MLSRLLLALPFLFQAAPPSKPDVAEPPPIKMGLWEATVTTATGMALKTRSCVTAQSYREQLEHLPQGCKLSNVQRSSTSMSGDVSCTLSGGATSSGHIDAQFPDPSTVHSTINVTATREGRSIPITFTTDSHFVSADCEDLQPGQSKVLQ